MTRQYKSMQEELLNRVNTLENTNTELRDQLELARVNFEEMKHEKDRIIAAKNLEIQELKAKMEEMAQEFGDMLKETLDKMRERIEITNTSFENDGGSLPMMRRLEEFNLGSPQNPDSTVRLKWSSLAFITSIEGPPMHGIVCTNLRVHAVQHAAAARSARASVPCVYYTRMDIDFSTPMRLPRARFASVVSVLPCRLGWGSPLASNATVAA
ncbi:hypothetical protein GQ600_13966 [Phytophthora cactorum]|nr:hypothetical protein GQ600_13966 [Phytophthora cactorum]